MPENKLYLKSLGEGIVSGSFDKMVTEIELRLSYLKSGRCKYLHWKPGVQEASGTTMSLSVGERSRALLP